MRSVQLRGNRRAVHTVGMTEDGILYVDIQKFARNRSAKASTYYVRASDVARIKRLASQWRSTLISDVELVRLFAASFRTADYALEWLRWAGISTVVRNDDEACCNAEVRIPQEALS